MMKRVFHVVLGLVAGVGGLLVHPAAARAQRDAPRDPAAANGTRANAPSAPSDASTPTREELDEEALLVQGETTFDPAHSPTLEVKRTRTGHLLVRPAIQGQRPGWFIFDTGAGVCVLSTPKVEALGLRDAGEIPAVGVGGSKMAGLVRASEVTLGPITLRDHPFMVTDLSFLHVPLGDEIAGVIGYGVLSRSVCELTIGDSETPPRISLFDPERFDLEREHPGATARGLAWSALRIDNRIPAIQGRFEDRDAWFRLDTGANGAVTFHASAVERWDLLEGRELSDIRLGGVGGFVRGKRGTIRWIELSGVRRENVEASFALEKKGAFGRESIDGNLGAELIRAFTLVLDYKRERAVFVPRGTGGAAGR